MLLLRQCVTADAQKMLVQPFGNHTNLDITVSMCLMKKGSCSPPAVECDRAFRFKRFVIMGFINVCQNVNIQ